MCSSIHPIISTLLQDLKLTKHWFSSFQWAPLQEGMNEICATFRPPITIFLMAGALTISNNEYCQFLHRLKSVTLKCVHVGGLSNMIIGISLHINKHGQFLSQNNDIHKIVLGIESFALFNLKKALSWLY